MQSRLKTIDEQLCTLCLNRAMEAYCGVYAQRMRTGNMTQHFAAIHKKLKDRPFAVATPMKSYFAYMGFPPCVMLQRQDSIETMKANSLNSWRYVPGVRGDGRKQHLTRVKEGANAIMLAIGLDGVDHMPTRMSAERLHKRDAFAFFEYERARAEALHVAVRVVDVDADNCIAVKRQDKLETKQYRRDSARARGSSLPSFWSRQSTASPR